MVVLTSFTQPTDGIRHRQNNTTVFVNDNNLGKGTLFIAESRLSWVSDSGNGFSLEYPHISLHAVSRDLSAFPQECLFLMLDAAVGAEEITNGDTDDGNENCSDEETTEIRLVPDDRGMLEAMFHAMNACQALHPDPEDSFSDEDFFEDADDEIPMEETGHRMAGLRIENTDGRSYIGRVEEDMVEEDMVEDMVEDMEEEGTLGDTGVDILGISMGTVGDISVDTEEGKAGGREEGTAGDTGAGILGISGGTAGDTGAGILGISGDTAEGTGVGISGDTAEGTGVGISGDTAEGTGVGISGDTAEGTGGGILGMAGDTGGGILGREEGTAGDWALDMGQGDRSFAVEYIRHQSRTVFDPPATRSQMVLEEDSHFFDADN